MLPASQPLICQWAHACTSTDAGSDIQESKGMSGVSCGQRGLCCYLICSHALIKGIYLCIMLVQLGPEEDADSSEEPALLSWGCSAVVPGPQFLTLGLNSGNPVRTKLLVWTGHLGEMSLLHQEGDLSIAFFVGFNKDSSLEGWGESYFESPFCVSKLLLMRLGLSPGKW